MSNLDRALCERLQIPPIDREWRVVDATDCYLSGDHDECQQFLRDWASVDPADCIGVSVVEEVTYPALSTTGDGMVLLMEALRSKTGRNCRVGTEANGRCRAIVFPNAPTFLERFNALSSGTADTPPMALALAAAAALGIEVQP